MLSDLRNKGLEHKNHWMHYWNIFFRQHTKQIKQLIFVIIWGSEITKDQIRLFTFRKQKSNFWWLMLGVYIGFIYVIYRSTQLYGRFYYSSFVNKHKLKYLRLKLDVKIRNSLWEILILKLWIKKNLVGCT